MNTKYSKLGKSIQTLIRFGILDNRFQSLKMFPLQRHPSVLFGQFQGRCPGILVQVEWSEQRSRSISVTGSFDCMQSCVHAFVRSVFSEM